MTKKDFELITRVIHSLELDLESGGLTRQGITLAFADALETTNPNFQRKRFIDACLGLKGGVKPA